MRRFFLVPLLLAFALAVSVKAADPDTTPPTLVSAIRASTNTYQIQISFSERMDPESVLQETNYRIRTLSGSPVLTLNAVLVETNTGVSPRSSQNLIISASDEILLTRDWGLVVSNVTDTNGNKIVTMTNIITTVETLIPRESDWYRRDDGYYPEFSAWRFTDDSWAQPDYPYESQFILGVGAFYLGTAGVVPPNGNTTLCCYPNETAIASTTAYFRREFNLQGSVYNSTFLLKYIIDDGAVLYINGKEAWRTNISAAITKPTYRTLASASGNNTTWRPTTGFLTLPLNNFVAEGNNHIAVEVHQRSASDPTSAFGLELIQVYTNRIGGPVSIVQGPANLTNVVEGTTATFEVKPDGKPVFKYKWFLIDAAGKTNAIANATNRVLSLTQVPLSYNGAKVFVEVIGGTSPTIKATSAPATMTVVPDVTAPALVSAVYEEDSELITLTFSEAMKASAATDKANYTVTNHLGQAVAIESIQDVDGRSYTLKPVTPLTGAARVYITPKNLTDNAGVPNALASYTIMVGGTFTLVPFASEWHYYQKGTNPPVQTGWQRKDYVENSEWDVANALFYNEDPELLLPARTTLLPLQDSEGRGIITYYFRKTFDFGGPTNGVRLTYGHYVDDGMVVWLNNFIAARFLMTGTAAPTYAALASNREGDAVLTNGLAFAITNLTQGANQLAVEVHQSSADSSDVVFDLELLANVPTTTITTNAAPQPPVKLSVAKNGNTVRISWPTPPAGSVLESTTTLSPANWQPINGATSPYTAPNSTADKARYYRLRQP